MSLSILRNQSFIDFMYTIIGKNIYSYSNDISQMHFDSKGINYCVLLKSPKGYIKNRF